MSFAEPADIDGAVAAASRAFDTWRRASLAARSKVLFSLRELVHQRAPELADLITSEHGKVFSDALGEVQRGLEVIEFACGMAHVLKGSFSAEASTGIDVTSLRQPLGPVVVISPFNFPAMVPCWFVPVAIAAGNTVILKPSEKDPSAANWLAERWADAGLPDGVLNVVHGDAVAVDALLEHPDVRAVSFVGSTPVARHIYETGPRHGKRVQALGGAKNHMVVLPDADLDVATDAAVTRPWDRPANGAWPSRWRWSSSRSAMPSSAGWSSVWRRCGSATAVVEPAHRRPTGQARSNSPTWDPWSRGSTWPGSPAMSKTGRRPGRHWWWTVTRSQGPGRPRRVLLGPHALRPGPSRDGDLP